jgi:hypothetical protein
MDPQMVGVVWLIGAFLFGLLNCFFGYRLFIVTVAIAGFVIGASLGYAIGIWTGYWVVGLIAAVVGGLIAGWACMMAYYAFIFVVGGIGFALAASFLAGLFMTDVHILIPIAAGLIGGFLSVWLQRLIIINATAAQGALASVLAVAALVSGGGTSAYRDLFDRLFAGELSNGGGAWFYIGLTVWLVLVIAGALTQFKRGGEMYRRQPRLIGAP